MEESKKEPRIRIEAPSTPVPGFPAPLGPASLPRLYYVLLVLTFIFCALSLYLSFAS